MPTCLHIARTPKEEKWNISDNAKFNDTTNLRRGVGFMVDSNNIYYLKLVRS